MASREKLHKPLSTEMGFATPTQVTVYKRDLIHELLGDAGFVSVFFLGLMGRDPSPAELRTLDALLVSLMEHGQTPSTVVTRLTYWGGPEALQASVAAGLLGLGSRIVGSIEDAARMLQEVPVQKESAIPDIARSLVDGIRERGALVPGVGHLLHRPVDPRAERLFAIATEEGSFGYFCALMRAVGAEAERSFDRPLPVNVTGAVGAIASDLGFPWEITRGLGLISRAAGLVCHIGEEMRDPIAKDIWRLVEENSAH